MIKKIISVVLVAVMAAGILAVGAYAQTSPLFGDANSDGEVNSSDALAVLQCSTGIRVLSSMEQAIADVDASGDVGSSDALLILQKITGLVNDFAKETVETLKSTKIDPVFASENGYSFTVVMQEPTLGEVEMIFSTDGENKVISTVVEYQAGLFTIPVEIRMLHKDGKNYQVVPTITVAGQTVQGTYSDLEEDVELMFDSYSKLFTANVVYSHSKEAAFGGKTYNCEVFCGNNNSVLEYYFDNGKLEYLNIKSDDTTQMIDVKDFKAQPDTARLSIPSDYVYEA